MKYRWIILLTVGVLGMVFVYWQYRVPRVDLIATNSKIEQQLDALLLDEPGAILARVALFHRQRVDDHSAPLLTWNIAYVRAARSYQRSTALSFNTKDQPMGLLGQLIDDLMAGRCLFIMRNNFVEKSTREHLAQLDIFSSIICPIIGTDRLQGAMFIGWPEDKTPAEPTAMMPSIQQTAARIAKLIANE